MRQPSSFPLHTRPVQEEILTPRQYVMLAGKSCGRVKSTHIVPPTLGSKDFGGVKVRYRTPVYRAVQ